MHALSNKIKNLKKSKSSFLVPKFLVFDVKTFDQNSEYVFKEVRKKFKKNYVAIRSSSIQEDNRTSNAGKYHSELNVNIKKKNILEATRKVIDSYDPKYRNREKFIIQKMITDSKITGVIFTRDQNHGTPFTTINFTLGKQTDLITSGRQNGYVYKFLNSYSPKFNKFDLNKIFKFISKLKKTLKFNNLDIEFSISNSGRINLLQVRKLNCKNFLNESKVFSSYRFLEKKLIKILTDNSFLKGKYTIYSTMTDWNPAEIIGIKPNQLSYSLYSELITDYVWSKSRASFNYCDLGETPLMFNFLGTPFIDLRADFNSFIPNNLAENLKNKLVNYYLRQYKKKPDFYFDKVESELILGNIDFSVNKKINKLKEKFNNKEIDLLKSELVKITNNSFDILNKSILKYKKLDLYLNRINRSKSNPINKIYNYLNICKNYGTYPFANIARCAFISKNFLNSMIDEKIITSSEGKSFFNSFTTITSEMLNNLENTSKSIFLKKFGHLRPSTYDINSLNYRENFDAYFKKTTKRTKTNKKNNFKFSNHQKELINKKLNELNLSISFDGLVSFIKKSVIHREQSKFCFTKAIELIFLELKRIGKRFNISKNDLCYVDIKILKNLYNNFTLSEVRKILKQNINENKLNYKFNKNLPLPNNIIKENDIFSIFESHHKPTFITDKKVKANNLELNHKNLTNQMSGKIICIKNADPGFDFIFTKNIKGLITEYGGPNSHMCIRCSELAIPAAIGVGSRIYEKIKNSQKTLLDCFNQKISTE